MVDVIAKLKAWRTANALSQRQARRQLLICHEGDALVFYSLEVLPSTWEIDGHRKPHPVLIGDRILPAVFSPEGMTRIKPVPLFIG
jgi:hypothetical protein